jgi:hypothetical protein
VRRLHPKRCRGTDNNSGAGTDMSYNLVVGIIASLMVWFGLVLYAELIHG